MFIPVVGYDEGNDEFGQGDYWKNCQTKYGNNKKERHVSKGIIEPAATCIGVDMDLWPKETSE
jgi:hypothetical protein